MYTLNPALVPSPSLTDPLPNPRRRPIRLGGVQRRFTASGAVASPANADADTLPTAPNGQTLMLHNTMKRKKEPFVPRDAEQNKVSMYVCGVTVYDYSHIGHARVYVAFDVLYRQLTRMGYDVTYCRNFTDVDDKIIKRAAENGETCDALVDRFIDAFHEDIDALGCVRPTMEPRATDHIGDITALCERLIEKGYAYSADGDVYFSVDALPEYGSLSGRKLEDNRAGERVAVDTRKKNPADFALWKAAKPGEPTWDSPWGAGRPGWHIECSAMIESILGKSIDIHGGGQDLVFPHHENELAQSTASCRCCTEGELGLGGEKTNEEPEEPFVRYWVHNGFVKVDSEKMSKSLGNFFTIREVTERYHPTALRWMLLGTHYRAPINYTQRALEEASDRLYYLYQTLVESKDALVDAQAKDAETASETKPKPKPPTGIAAEGIELAAETTAAVDSALADDLNTPLAIASLSAPLKTLNDLVSTKKGKKAVGRSVALSDLIAAVETTLESVGLPREGGEGLLEELRELTLRRAGLTRDDVDAAVAARAEARAAKDFAESDRIRDEFGAKGVALMDGGNQVWRPATVVDDK
jgi:cysteinyl-tRNA synthetase